MSSNSSQLNGSEDSEVMVRQVNLAAAFHDHISCTKISQQSMTTSICSLQTSVSDETEPQNSAINSMGSEPSVAFESDHMYATENKSFNDTNSLTTNGCLRTNSLFTNSLSEERNQISKLTEMILGQLDLIQHQQEQLLKKDRQLQGLKQDREALCLRLEKMEKRIAVLTAKVANNNTNNVVNSANINCVNSNAINNTILNRNIVNNSQSSTNTIETDCDQSGSDTIIEDNQSVGGLFTDPTVFTKLYSNSSAVNSNNLSANNINNTTNSCKSSPKAINIDINTTSTDNSTDSPTNIQIKTEPQISEECEESITNSTTVASSQSVRKSRKRHSEVLASATTTTPTATSNKKRIKTLSSSCDSNTIDIKKELINIKETSSDSLSTLSTTVQTNKTFNNFNNNKKRVIKQKSETSSRLDTTHVTSSSLNCRTSSLTRDVLLTSKPYSIVVNNSDYSPLELSVNNSPNDLIDNKTNSSLIENNLCEEKSRTSDDLDVIEVPNWRLHPVSSCYSLEGTENLDDDVFNRRHQKSENDERRRKRWDIQRLREQRHNEKLRTGRYYSSSLGNCFIEKPSDLKKKTYEFSSFYPDIKNLQSIEVAEKIPFIAFGHPIPKLPTKCFSIPWNISERTQTATKTRNTPQKKN